MSDLYKTGETSATIAKKSGLPIKRVRLILKAEGIDLKAGWEYLKVNTQNDNYFECIDSADKAYFLGLLYSDGNVYLKRNRVQLTLHNDDVEIMGKFAIAMGYSGPFYNDRGKYTKMIICSKKMVQDLIKLGCGSKKSLTLTFPNSQQVPSSLLSHFLRGYFDGDGCVYIQDKKFAAASFTCTSMFASGIAELLSEYGIATSKFYKRYKVENSAGEIKIQRRSTVEFYIYLYRDSNGLFLSRKYDKFKSVLV